MRLICLGAWFIVAGLLPRPPVLDGRPWADSGPAPTEPPEGWMDERVSV